MKIKLRDLTEEQFIEWKIQNGGCRDRICENCVFKAVNCAFNAANSWVKHKELFTDKFLEQEIEIEVEPILTDKEKAYLFHIIKPFRNRVVWIKKQDYYSDGQYIKIEIKKDVPVVFPLFEENKYYKNMEVDKKYTLEELDL